MGVMAYPLRYALADLALALSRAADDAAEVRATAARAAPGMIGDGAGGELPRARRRGHDRRRRRGAAAARRRPLRRHHLPPPGRRTGSAAGPAPGPGRRTAR